MLHIPSWKPEYDEKDEGEDADEDATIDSTDDIPSRNRLKMNSKMRVNAPRQETGKKRVKQQSSLPKEIELDDTILMASEQVSEELITPSKSRPKKTDPMDGVRAFLTELPPEGEN
ncbi:hypothetical protein ACHAXA_000338 [Cyclostephanos tholiformis]|jgi:hypothetical protein|uniref:Uncharacterized protein n=1 Tax=Cyclostephanos tholiformis TaxID=382380 RepID=A0ABD3RPV6_9STRA